MASSVSDSTGSRATRSMAALGRSVLRRARQAYYARAICGGFGVFALVVACAIQRGANLGDPEALGLATLLGLLAFGAWVRSETVRSRDVLSRVDQRMHLAGAFLAAQESCARVPESPIAQLGAARLLQRIRPGQVLEAAVPHTLGFVLLPLLGLLVLVQTVQSRDDRRGLAGRRTVEVGAVADRIGDIADAGTGALTEEQRAQLAEIQRDAREAAEQAADESLGIDQDPTDGAEDWRQQMRELADELEALASEAPSGSEIAEELSEAAAAAEALAMDASTASGASGDEVSGGPEEGGGAGAGEAPGDGSGAGSGDSSTLPEPLATRTEPELATGGQDPASESLNEPSGESDPRVAAEEILPVRPWWSRRDDGIVRAWLARQKSPSGSK